MIKKQASQANLYINPFKKLQKNPILSRFFIFIGSSCSSKVTQKISVIKQLQTTDLTKKNNDYNADKKNYDFPNKAKKYEMVSEILKEPNVSDAAYQKIKTNVDNDNSCCNKESQDTDKYINRKVKKIKSYII